MFAAARRFFFQTITWSATRDIIHKFVSIFDVISGGSNRKDST